MATQNAILNRLSADLEVEHNLLMEEVMTASYLKSLFRSTMENWDNYSELKDALAEIF